MVALEPRQIQAKVNANIYVLSKILCHFLFVTRSLEYTSTSVVCTRISVVCTRTSVVCTCISVVCTCISVVCTSMYSYFIRMYSYLLVWCFSYDPLILHWIALLFVI